MLRIKRLSALFSSLRSIQHRSALPVTSDHLRATGMASFLTKNTTPLTHHARFSSTYEEKSYGGYFTDVKAPREPSTEALMKVLMDEGDDYDTDMLLTIKRMTAANPDLEFINEKKLLPRVRDLSKIVLNPSFYKAFTSRHVNFNNRSNRSIPFEAPINPSHTKPYHPLVKHIISRYPMILRRKDMQAFVKSLEELLPGYDAYELLGKYPLLLTLDLTNRVHDKIFYLNNIFEDADTVASLIAAQPDLLHSKTEEVASRRMDAIADYLDLSNEEVIAFVKSFPRAISTTLPNRDIQRLAVFRMAHPNMPSERELGNFGRSDAFAKDMLRKLNKRSLHSAADREQDAYLESDNDVSTQTYKSYFSSQESLFEAMRLVALMKDSVFKALFPEYATARKQAHVRRASAAALRSATQRSEHRQLAAFADAEYREEEEEEEMGAVNSAAAIGVEVHQAITPDNDVMTRRFLRDRALFDAQIERTFPNDGRDIDEERDDLYLDEVDAELRVDALDSQLMETDEAATRAVEQRVRQGMNTSYGLRGEWEEGKEERGVLGKNTHIWGSKHTPTGAQPHVWETGVDHNVPGDLQSDPARMRMLQRDRANEKEKLYRGRPDGQVREEEIEESELARELARKLRLEQAHQGMDEVDPLTQLRAEEDAIARRRERRREEKRMRTKMAQRDGFAQSWYGAEIAGPKQQR